MPRTPKRLAMNNTLVQSGDRWGQFALYALRRLPFLQTKTGSSPTTPASIAPSCTASISVHLVRSSRLF